MMAFISHLAGTGMPRNTRVVIVVVIGIITALWLLAIVRKR